MKRTLVGLIIAFMGGLLLLWSVMPAGADTSSEEETATSREHQIIVQYRKAEPAGKKWGNSITEKILSRNQLAPRTELIQLDDETQLNSMINSMKKDADVLYVEENKKRMLMGTVSLPNDPYYSRQWGLSKISALNAWGILSTADSAVVAVIDSGITSTHADLMNRIASGGKSFLSGPFGGSTLSDSCGHGTEVSGVIAAETNNSVGICGVAGTGSIKILPLKTADRDGASYVSDVIEAIDYAISKDVDVINLSMGSEESSSIENAAVQRAIQAGIVVVASAGNDGKYTYEYPASYDNVISVGSIAETGNVSTFSTYNDKVDLVAPGENIYTCTNRGSYYAEDGTSFSAPMVSAVAAVLKSLDSSLTLAEIESILTSSAVDCGSSGKDNYYGYGVLNFYNAVKTFNPPPTLTSIAITSPANKLIYTIGDTLDLSGLVVTGIYSDGSIKTESITTANVTGFNNKAAATNQVLTITVGNKITTYQVQIVAPVTLKSIAITSPANKLTYNIGDELDITGLVVTGTYSDGSTRTENITIANVTGFNSETAASKQLLTITVGGKTTQYTVQVYASIKLASSLAQNIAARINQDQQFCNYFDATANGDTVDLTIRSGQEEANLEESFDVLGLMTLLIHFEGEQDSSLDTITIAGSTFSRNNLINDFTVTYQALQQAIISLAGAFGTPYADLQLKQLAGQTIQARMADGQIINLTIKLADECFIATAAFGSKFTWPVALLRHFRDQYLLTNTGGIAFVAFYYHYSPPVAAFIAGSRPLKVLVRVLLAPIIVLVLLIYHPLLMITIMTMFIMLFVYRSRLRKRCVEA